MKPKFPAWRPMRTAPKDGTQILVWEQAFYSFNGGNFEDVSRPMIVQWGRFYGDYGRAHWHVPDSVQDEQGGASQADFPTGWMPVPTEPPKGHQARFGRYKIKCEKNHAKQVKQWEARQKLSKRPTKQSPK